MSGVSYATLAQLRTELVASGTGDDTVILDYGRRMTDAIDTYVTRRWQPMTFAPRRVTRYYDCSYGGHILNLSDNTINAMRTAGMTWVCLRSVKRAGRLPRCAAASPKDCCLARRCGGASLKRCCPETSSHHRNRTRFCRCLDPTRWRTATRWLTVPIRAICAPCRSPFPMPEQSPPPPW